MTGAKICRNKKVTLKNWKFGERCIKKYPGKKRTNIRIWITSTQTQTDILVKPKKESHFNLFGRIENQYNGHIYRLD